MGIRWKILLELQAFEDRGGRSGEWKRELPYGTSVESAGVWNERAWVSDSEPKPLEGLAGFLEECATVRAPGGMDFCRSVAKAELPVELFFSIAWNC